MASTEGAKERSQGSAPAVMGGPGRAVTAGQALREEEEGALMMQVAATEYELCIYVSTYTAHCTATRQAQQQPHASSLQSESLAKLHAADSW